MGSVNKAIVLGNLGQDPEVRMTQGGQQVCTLNIATSDTWTNKDGKREERTEWHRVVMWGKLAELAGKYLKKGRRVYLEGKLQTRNWDDQNGVKRYTTEIVASQMVFVDSGARGGAEPDMVNANDYGSQPQQNYGNPQQNYSSPQAGFDSSPRPMGSDFNAPVDDSDVPF